MKRKIIFLALVVAFQAIPVEAQKTVPTSKPKILSAREIAEKVMPSVVLIITQDENGKPISQGSGFVYKPGLVVSNLHVFERASNAIVKNVKTGEVSKVIEVVGINAVDDICVVRINNGNIPALPLGDSSVVRTGDEIYVASNPKGLEGTLTKGIVSSLRTREQLFQIDAAISSGSSGGLLTNSNAEAIGIIKSSLVTGQNLNFAIPISKLLLLRERFKHPVVLAGAIAYTDAKQDRLIGPVRTVSQTMTNDRYLDLDSEEFLKGVTTKKTTKYNLFGNNTEVVSYSPIDNTSEIFATDYDESGLKIKTTLTRKAKSEPQVWNVEDAIENKIEFRKFSNSVGRFSYDAEGKEQQFDGPWFKITFKYDSLGNILEKRQLEDAEIQSISRFEYKFDRVGNWIERTEFLNYPSIDQNWRVERKTFRQIEYYDF